VEEGDCYHPKNATDPFRWETSEIIHGASDFFHARRERTADGRDEAGMCGGIAAPEDPWNSRGPDASSSSILTRLTRRRSHSAFGVKSFSLSLSPLSLSLSLSLSLTRARTLHTHTYTHMCTSSNTRPLAHSLSFVGIISVRSHSLARACRRNTRARVQAALTNTINPLWGRIPDGAFRMYVRVRGEQRQEVSK